MVMQRKTSQALQKYSFWIALLCHLLLFSAFTLGYLFTQPMFEKSPELYIPSYVYRGVQKEVPQQPVSQLDQPSPKNMLTSKNGIEKPVVINPRAARSYSKPIDITSSKDSEPVHLVGEKKIVKPLLKILGKAFTAHLSYPKMAVDFNVHGTALVGFVIHPDGNITDVQLVKSSSAAVLDNAALAAVSQSSPVLNVNPYLNQPTFLVVGVIFGS